MKQFAGKIASDRILRLSTIISCTLLFVHALYILLIYRNLPPYIPLYNQLPWGEERLGTTPEIIFPFVVAAVVLLINLTIIIKTYEKMPLIARIMSITTLLITLLSCIFIVRTTLLIL